MLYVRPLLASETPERNGKCEEQQRKADGQIVAVPREGCRRMGARDMRVDPSRPVHRDRFEHPSIGIDHGADPGRGRPDDRQPFLDCPQPRLRQMLRRPPRAEPGVVGRSEEHTSELQSLMRISYAVFCLKKKNTYTIQH